MESKAFFIHLFIYLLAATSHHTPVHGCLHLPSAPPRCRCLWMDFPWKATARCSPQPSSPSRIHIFTAWQLLWIIVVLGMLIAYLAVRAQELADQRH